MNQTALLIIDTQTALIEPAYQGMAVLDRIKALLIQARASHAPVIYVQHDGAQGDGLEVGTAGWQIHPVIAPQEGEAVVHKRASDSFYDTSLEQELRARNIQHLVVVGGQTEYCVDTSVRRATTMGYNVTLVSDGHTTFDNPVLSAAQIIAHTNATLDGFNSDDNVITVKSSNVITF